ncbi:hypothetical protein QYF36_003637 [Acer negundo]|nr:hypothetical protein QYF36_003637 [Acer negundo]
MTKPTKLIKEILPTTKPWTVKVIVAEKTLPQTSQHSAYNYQRLILVDSEKGSEVDKGKRKANGQSHDTPTAVLGSSKEQMDISGQAQTAGSLETCSPSKGVDGVIDDLGIKLGKHPLNTEERCRLETKKPKGRGNTDPSEETTLQDSMKMGETITTSMEILSTAKESKPTTDCNNRLQQLRHAIYK